MQKRRPLSLSLLALVSLQAFACDYDKSNENFMRQIATKVALGEVPKLFFSGKHRDYTGHVALRNYQQEHPTIYVQNTTPAEQDHIQNFYEHVCNGESLDLFFNSQNLQAEMHAVVPDRSFLPNNHPETPTTLVTLSVLLAHQAAHIIEKAAGEAIGSLCGTEQNRLQGLTWLYRKNAQELTQHGARPETRDLLVGAPVCFHSALRFIHSSIHLKENIDYPLAHAYQIVNGNNEFQGLTGLYSINERDYRGSLLPKLQRILHRHSLYTYDEKALNRVSSSDQLPISAEDIFVGEFPSYVDKPDAQLNRNKDAKTIEDFVREGNIAQLTSRAFMKISLEGEEDRYSLEPNPIRIVCGEYEECICLENRRYFTYPKTNEQGLSFNDWKPIKEDEYQKDCEKFNYYYRSYSFIPSYYRQEKGGVKIANEAK